MSGVVAIKFFFLHNPKAGGSSVRTALARGASIAPTFANAPNDYRQNGHRLDDHSGYDFYAGHYGHDVFARLGRDHVLVTNFRDPVQRIQSLYRFWRHNVPSGTLGDLHPRDAEVVALAKTVSFPEFIRSGNDDLRLYISNFHFRQLLGCGWTWNANGWSELLQVKWRIRRMAWFFIAETAEASCLLLRDLSPELATITIPRENRGSGEPADISIADAEHLVDLNRLDYAIYSYAVGIQADRLKKLRSPDRLAG